MTAGKGIVHSEMPGSGDEDNVGLQLWVNLKASEKVIEMGGGGGDSESDTVVVGSMSCIPLLYIMATSCRWSLPLIKSF